MNIRLSLGFIALLAMGCSERSRTLALPQALEDAETRIFAVRSKEQVQACALPKSAAITFQYPNNERHELMVLGYERAPDRLPSAGVDQCPLEPDRTSRPEETETLPTALPPKTFFNTFDGDRYTEWVEAEHSGTNDPRALAWLQDWRFARRPVRCPELRFESFDMEALVPGFGGITMLELAPDGGAIIGSENGLLGRIDLSTTPPRFTEIARVDAEAHVTAAHFSSHGQLYLGRADGAVYRADPSSFQPESELFDAMGRATCYVPCSVDSGMQDPPRIATPENRRKFGADIASITSRPVGDSDEIWAISTRSQLAKRPAQGGPWVLIPGTEEQTSTHNRKIVYFEGAIVGAVEERTIRTNRSTCACEDFAPNDLLRPYESIRVLPVDADTSTSSHTLIKIPGARQINTVSIVGGRLYLLGQKMIEEASRPRYFYIQEGNGLADWGEYSAEVLSQELFAFTEFEDGLLYGGSLGRVGFFDIPFNQGCTSESSFAGSVDIQRLIQSHGRGWGHQHEKSTLVSITVRR